MRTQLIVLAISLATCELLLQLVALSPLRALLEPTLPDIPDPVLGKRGNPRYPSHDARGYRNAEALAAADVVAIGDSLTYGVGVGREEAWPALLAAHLKRSVYSMAHGGYGPGQYERMLPEALALRPRLVVIAPYMGNDLYEAYAFARNRPVPARLAELAAAAADMEKTSSIEEQAAELWALGRRTPLRSWLVAHVQLYRLAYHVRQRVGAPPGPQTGNLQKAVAALTPNQRLYTSVVDGPDWRTIIRARYRRLGLDQRDPRILLGFELSVDSLVSMAARCRREHVDVVVVILPTKSSVFWPRITDIHSHSELREVVEDEEAFRQRLIQRLREADVAVLDPLPRLRASTAQPFPENLDGHPNPIGHRIIADHIAAWILEHPIRQPE